MYSKPKKPKRRQILRLDYDDESSRSTPSPTTIVQSNGRQKSPPDEKEKPATVMDDEFANFMAEIDAIEGGETPEQPKKEVTPEPLAAPLSPVQELEEGQENEEEETFGMEEPTCQWQQCLDESTNCYYYWHMNSNEVSWEIPPEYTQHILLYREYEDALAAFNARKAAREAQKTLVQPPPPPPPETEEEEPEEEIVPTTEQGRNFLWFMRDHEREEKAKQEEKKRAYAQKFVKGKTLDEEKLDIHVEEPKPEEDREEMLKKLSGHSVAMLQGKGKSKFLQRIGAYHSETDGRSQSPTVVKESVQKEVEVGDDDDEEEDELALLEELQKKQEELLALEMEVCTPSAMTPEPPPPEPETSAPPPPPPPPQDAEPPLPPEEPPCKRVKLEPSNKADKTTESQSNDSKSKEATEFVPKEGSLALTKDQSEIEDLSSVLVSKLECMQITRETMSKMQILLVEIQTRIIDWVAGALTTSHFLAKLREADKQITEYETIATPPGWTCHYDRESKQYYYMNTESGVMQWEYPITKADMPLEFGAKEAKTEMESIAVIAPPPRTTTPSPPPLPDLDPPPPPPGIVHKMHSDLPPPPPPPGIEPSSPEHVDMDIDEDSDVTVPELLPPPVPAALRPKTQSQQYYPMGHYYPRPRPYAPVMGPYSYPMDPNYYGAPAPPPSHPEPPVRPAHVSAAPVLFNAKENKTEKPIPISPPPETKPIVTEPPKPSDPEPVAHTASLPAVPAQENALASAKKRKKKDKLKVNDSLSLKKKNVSGLVMKWQQAQQQVTQEVAKRLPDDT